MQPKRVIHPDVHLGKSVTRFHLVGVEMHPGSNVEVHASHYPDGDITKEAQWYGVYPHPREEQLTLLQEELSIDDDDWKLIEHTLGSFYWVIYEHTEPPARAPIRVDILAMKSGEWATTYF